jgi:hypothetical protein
MSRLSICVPSDASGEEAPQLLPFATSSIPFPARRTNDALARARLERDNRCCPHCGRVTVEPIELDDGLVGRSGGVIPGTATVVGFSCNACRHQWPAWRNRLAARF